MMTIDSQHNVRSNSSFLQHSNSRENVTLLEKKFTRCIQKFRKNENLETVPIIRKYDEMSSSNHKWGKIGMNVHK